ncbi:MAG: hypothetical protein WD738_13025 [Pirellulales bacterium]
MPIQIECPGCKALLQVPDELAGKQGKCIQCGHKLTVPGRASFGGGLSPTLFEATPEAMMRELYRRQHSALLLVFPIPADSSYDLSNVPDADLKCIATEDINQSRFMELVASFAKRYGPRKKGGSGSSPSLEDLLYELKGDRLGMNLADFKQKYARSGEGGHKLPLCSDTAWGANKASLQPEPWHKQASIINARIDLPVEDNSPTVAGVKTELLLYQFIDGKLFRIAGFLPTDQFHLVSEAAVKKYGSTTRESQKPRQLIWENPIASVILTRGTLHPREASTLELVHNHLAELAASRTPTGASDI